MTVLRGQSRMSRTNAGLKPSYTAQSHKGSDASPTNPRQYRTFQTNTSLWVRIPGSRSEFFPGCVGELAGNIQDSRFPNPSTPNWDFRRLIHPKYPPPCFQAPLACGVSFQVPFFSSSFQHFPFLSLYILPCIFVGLPFLRCGALFSIPLHLPFSFLFLAWGALFSMP